MAWLLGSTPPSRRCASSMTSSRQSRLHLATYHMNIEEPGFAQATGPVAPGSATFTSTRAIADTSGTGSIDFAECFAALESIGYNGTITFESFSSTVVAPELSSTLCIWRELWTDGMDLAIRRSAS